jgi:hypothetical protein
MYLLDARVQAQGTVIHLPAAAFGVGGMSPAGEITLDRVAGLMLQAWPTGVKITGTSTDAGAGRQRAGVVSDYLVAHGVPGLTADVAGERGEVGVDILMLK